ncbi:hypothetical protein [Paenibacillus wynnii]|uniref:Uncharacterized protein n=1 Tax=Paenibacillus wynnii TaxID=268407 RepID=A0A098MDM7_9BACL|nr:hypothetical protein [Paenibacillus wynnii]KGE20670.1 hypothetical protein PWYN_00255 [Paenibacillus wynnii]
MTIKFRITNKHSALIAALQAGAARDFAVAKSRRQFKHEKSTKKAYVPGNLGPSVVATAIKKEFGTILSRKERKALPIFIAFLSHQ